MCSTAVFVNITLHCITFTRLTVKICENHLITYISVCVGMRTSQIKLSGMDAAGFEPPPLQRGVMIQND